MCSYVVGASGSWSCLERSLCWWSEPGRARVVGVIRALVSARGRSPARAPARGSRGPAACGGRRSPARARRGATPRTRRARGGRRPRSRPPRGTRGRRTSGGARARGPRGAGRPRRRGGSRRAQRPGRARGGDLEEAVHVEEPREGAPLLLAEVRGAEDLGEGVRVGEEHAVARLVPGAEGRRALDEAPERPREVPRPRRPRGRGRRGRRRREALGRRLERGGEPRCGDGVGAVAPHERFVERRHRAAAERSRPEDVGVDASRAARCWGLAVVGPGRLVACGSRRAPAAQRQL